MPAPATIPIRTTIYPSIDPSNFKNALSNKVALVTGSGRGIGREMAFALAQAGAAVAITGRTKTEVDETTREVKKRGGKAVGVVVDVLVRSELEKLVKEVEKGLGPIDILICNAGTNIFQPFHMTDPDEWWHQMELMVKSPTELTRIILPSMQSRNSGTIIYTSSRAAEADLPWTAAYGCAKTAITRFAGVLQAECNILQLQKFKENGISVFSIHPGEIKTKLHETAYPEKTKKEAPYVIEMMNKMTVSMPNFQVELPAWTCVYLAAGRGKDLEGRMVDCTRDIEEVKKWVLSTPKPKFTNACG